MVIDVGSDINYDISLIIVWKTVSLILKKKQICNKRGKISTLWNSSIELTAKSDKYIVQIIL